MTEFNATAKVVAFHYGKREDIYLPVIGYIVEVLSPASKAGKRLELPLRQDESPLKPELDVGDEVNLVL